MEQSQATGAAGGAMSGAATGAAIGSVVPGIGTAIGAVAGAVIGGITGYLGGGGEKEAKKLAKAQANEILRAAAENRRVQEMQARNALGVAKATTYASNLQDMGSTKKYRTFMESEYHKAIMYDYSAAQTAAQLAKKGGQIAANTIQRQGFGQLLQGATALGTAYAGGAFGSDPAGTTSSQRATSIMAKKA